MSKLARFYYAIYLFTKMYERIEYLILRAGNTKVAQLLVGVGLAASIAVPLLFVPIVGGILAATAIVLITPVLITVLVLNDNDRYHRSGPFYHLCNAARMNFDLECDKVEKKVCEEIKRKQNNLDDNQHSLDLDLSNQRSEHKLDLD